MSKKNPKFYRVKYNDEIQLVKNTSVFNEARDGYAGRARGGQIGRLKYDNASFSEKQSGYPIVLEFDDGRTDGFFRGEVELIEVRSPLYNSMVSRAN